MFYGFILLLSQFQVLVRLPISVKYWLSFLPSFSPITTFILNLSSYRSNFNQNQTNSENKISHPIIKKLSEKLTS